MKRLPDKTLVRIAKPDHTACGLFGYAFQSQRGYRVYKVEGGLLGWFPRSALKRVVGVCPSPKE